ncbi:hypothetical protein N7497_011769 [Penicillium chrysogenum]|nr:hypothetical protein N7497_011769 [Penicillium chrysogenum]
MAFPMGLRPRLGPRALGVTAHDSSGVLTSDEQYDRRAQLSSDKSPRSPSWSSSHGWKNLLAPLFLTEETAVITAISMIGGTSHASEKHLPTRAPSIEDDVPLVVGGNINRINIFRIAREPTYPARGQIGSKHIDIARFYRAPDICDFFSTPTEPSELPNGDG